MLAGCQSGGTTVPRPGPARDHIRDHQPCRASCCRSPPAVPRHGTGRTAKREHRTPKTPGGATCHRALPTQLLSTCRVAPTHVRRAPKPWRMLQRSCRRASAGDGYQEAARQALRRGGRPLSVCPASRARRRACQATWRGAPSQRAWLAAAGAVAQVPGTVAAEGRRTREKSFDESISSGKQKKKTCSE